jgi:Fe-S oxidoreductase
MKARSPALELTDVILEVGGAGLLACMQCGTCTAVCPWPRVSGFNPRYLLRQAALGLEGYEQEDLWRCVTCRTCVTRCPRGVDLIDVMRAGRAVMLEAGTAPPTYRGPLASLRSDGNPWGGDRAQRGGWAAGLALPAFTPAHDYLWFTCCTQAYDPRNRKVARALAEVLRQAGVSFGVLDEEGSCCGDQARKMGAEEVYAGLRAANLDLFRGHGVARVIVSSPHCLQAFNGDYATEVPVHALHYAQLLAGLLREGQLHLTREVAARVTYHDPCYLGRHAGEYEAPREVLRAVPGLELVEMRHSRETSLCCGGGGGGLFLEVPLEERLAILRVQEAQATGASIIATACPYCTAMLEDAVKVQGLEGAIEVKDLAELCALSLSSAAEQP